MNITSKLGLLLSVFLIVTSAYGADEAARREGAAAGEPDSDSCGLGWQVTNKKTMIGTTTRGTTNAFIPPTFGMTSGTMGCVQHPFAKKDLEGATYAITNYDVLSVEMAQGRGEFLDGFARTLGCGDTEAFGRMTQKHYKEIMGGKQSAVQMFENLKQQLKNDAAASKGCA